MAEAPKAYETAGRQSTTVYVFPTKINVNSLHREEEVRLGIHYIENAIPAETLGAIAQNLSRAAGEMYPSDPSPIVVLHYHASVKKLDVHASEDAKHTRFILQADGLPPLIDALRTVKSSKADACLILESVETTEATSIPERLANQVDMAMYANVDVPQNVCAFLEWFSK
jgi:hypothetical protein